MFCKNCGAEIPEGGSFCGSCGTPVKEEPVAVREPEGSRPVMEGKEREKKTDASSEVRKNNPDIGVQSKGRKLLIIGVCSGALLLVVGTAILFATGIFGGKDKLKEAAEADEPKKVADLDEQQKEEVEEKPAEETKKLEQKELEQDISSEEMANEAFEAYKAYIREKGYDEEGRYSFCLFYLDEDDYPELSIRFESGSTGNRYHLYVFQDGEVTETDFTGMNEFGMYKERSGYLYDVLFHTGTVSCNVGILNGASVEMLAEELYDCFNEDGKEVGMALEEGFREKFGISDEEWRHTVDYATLEEAFEQLGSDGAENKGVNEKADLGIEDYLCSDSSTRILTQEDVEKLLSGTYDNLPEGKGIIQMAVNEMYARKGYQFGSQSIQNYFETKRWYREIEGRSDDQESIYQNMSDIEQANVQFLSSFADDEKINTTYDTDCFCIAKFELADGVLTVVDDGAPGVGWGNRNTFSFSLPISGDCQWQKAYYGVDGLVVMDEPYSYEDAVRDIAQWRENYNAALEGEEAALDSPVGLHIEVVDSVVVRVYTTWS